MISMEHYLYLAINLGSVLIPFIATFDRRLRFQRQWRFVFPAIFLTMLVFIPWDMLKTSLGVWGFNPRYLSGCYLGNLPVEEWLFFVTIPYSCLFTYHALKHLIKRDLVAGYAGLINLITGLAFLLIGLSNLQRLYTSASFISAGLFLLFHSFCLKKDYTGRFFLMYVVTLLPFFLVDGLLTGSLIPEEVVFYDNSQNLDIRLGTIPLEDMVYGMLLLLMNVSWYESLVSRQLKKEAA